VWNGDPSKVFNILRVILLHCRQHREGETLNSHSKKKKKTNTARYLETGFYSLTFYILVFHFYFNLNNF